MPGVTVRVRVPASLKKGEKDEMINGIKIICLCGSTRFTDQMLIRQWELTKQGYVVLSWCALPVSYFTTEWHDKTHIGDQEGVKNIVDTVHKRKIDLADEVLVLNINGYIGKSTKSEIDYALANGKVVRYLDYLGVDDTFPSHAWYVEGEEVRNWD